MTKTLSIEISQILSEYRKNHEVVPFVDINERFIEYGKVESGIMEYEYYKIPDGQFDRLVDGMREIISRRENPSERIEFWECRDFFGEYDPKIKTRLLKSRGVNLD